MTKAAAYARSSKDRSDVSLSAQLHELQKLAQTRGLTIAKTFEDAVQKGSTEDRPAFQELIAEIKRRDRGWSVLLVYDTSRIARGRYIAQAFRHQCRKYGVEIVCVRLPETDPVSAVILEAVFEAMDEVHSIMSRDKALAGMAQNVRRGFRAGGRAPLGYVLKHEQTGAIRDGKPVLKSKLEPSKDAPRVRDYLTARAGGTPRATAAVGMGKNPSTLVDVEWNALTYAGHTIWNRHTEKKARGTGGTRRRPRDEWQIQRDTHPALITEAQAEAILAQLETSDIGRAVSAAKRAQSRFLLSSVLETPDGKMWTGAGPHYRAPGKPRRHVKADVVDAAVMAQIRADLKSDAFIAEMVKAARLVDLGADSVDSMDKEIRRLERQREKAARLAVQDDGDAFVEMVADLGRQIAALRREQAAMAAEDRAAGEIRAITPDTLRSLLDGFTDDRALVEVVQRVTLDPATLEARLTYRLSLASPRRSGSWSVGFEGAPFRLAA